MNGPPLVLPCRLPLNFLNSSMVYGNIVPKKETSWKISHPSFEEWQSLYGAAIDYWKMQPWQWVNDTDLFGIKNPEDGEIGYCCVVGALGEFIGLVLYLGAKGLESYMKLQTSKSSEEEPTKHGKVLDRLF